MKTVVGVITERMKENGIKKEFISKKTNIPKVKLDLSLEGKRKLKSSELIALSLFLGLNINDFDYCVSI